MTLPYETYADKVIEDLRRKDMIGKWLIPAMTTSQLRFLLSDAFIAGVAHCNDLIDRLYPTNQED